MKARLMRWPVLDKTLHMWWSYFHIYHSKRTMNGWAIGAKNKVFVWAIEGSQAYGVLAEAKRHDVIEVSGRMLTGLWRRKNKPSIRTVAIRCSTAKILGHPDFIRRRFLTAKSLRRAREEILQRQMNEAKLSRQEKDRRTAELIASLSDEV